MATLSRLVTPEEDRVPTSWTPPWPRSTRGIEYNAKSLAGLGGSLAGVGESFLDEGTPSGQGRPDHRDDQGPR